MSENLVSLAVAALVFAALGYAVSYFFFRRYNSDPPIVAGMLVVLGIPLITLVFVVLSTLFPIIPPAAGVPVIGTSAIAGWVGAIRGMFRALRI